MSAQEAHDTEVEKLAQVIQEALVGISIYLGPNAMAMALRGEAIPLSLGEKWLISNLAARAAIKHMKGPAGGRT